MSVARRLNARLRGWLPTIVMVLVMLAFRSSLADWYDVPSGSMQPTILVGERVVVNKLAYGLRVPFTGTRVATWAGPERGDVVTFPSPRDGQRLVKRVVAVAGDEVAMQDGRLVLNGHPLAYDLGDPPVYPLRPTDPRDPAWLVEELPGKPHAVMRTDQAPRLRNWGPVRVPDGRVLVLGDNRDNSADGRVFGWVDAHTLEGRVEAIALSLDRDRWYKPRWRRFGTDL
ncbi:MAG: signal peptidase I [Candidatus Krumholzibacteriia bacterium]